MFAAPLPLPCARRAAIVRRSKRARRDLGDHHTGAQVASFPLIPKVSSTRPARLRRHELYYTDENLNLIQVYSTTGTLNRTLPKPADWSRLWARRVRDAALLVSLDASSPRSTSHRTQPDDVLDHGARTSHVRRLAQLAFRDRQRQHDREGALAGRRRAQYVDGPAVVRGLGFSSSANVLYARAPASSTRSIPTPAAAIGAPAQIQVSRRFSRPAHSRREALLEFCGDGEVNVPAKPAIRRRSRPTVNVPSRLHVRRRLEGRHERAVRDGETGNTMATATELRRGNCQFEPGCGDGIIQPIRRAVRAAKHRDLRCQLPSLEICLDLVDNDGDGLIDCTDPIATVCRSAATPVRSLRRPGTGDLFAVHGSLQR
jgi:hypothetical protein